VSDEIGFLQCMHDYRANVVALAFSLSHLSCLSFSAPGTVVCICHRLERISEFDLVFVLEAGRVVESGPPRELIGRPGGGRLAALVESYNVSHQ
jgi:ABC-type transport system involved in Fe-S cluster assembly fused permease/ATPase subunit